MYLIESLSKMGYIFQLQILFCYNFSKEKKKNKQTNVANFDIEGTVTLHLPDTCTLLTACLLLLLAQFDFIMQEGDDSISAY